MPATHRYDRLSIFFHWATLAILVLSFASIEGRVLFERGTYIRTAVKEWHYVLGLLILLMTLARLFNRLSQGKAPPITPRLPAWQEILSMAMHMALYATLIALPVLGLITVNSLGDPLHFGFGINLPPFFAVDEARGEWLEGLHSFLGDTLYVLIGGPCGGRAGAPPHPEGRHADPDDACGNRVPAGQPGRVAPAPGVAHSRAGRQSWVKPTAPVTGAPGVP